MINVLPKLSFEVSANVVRQDAPKPAGDFSRDMKNALTRSSQDAPKSTDAAKIETKQISDSDKKSDLSVSDVTGCETQEKKTDEMAVTGENVMPFVDLTVAQADIEQATDHIMDDQIVETQNKTIAFMPEQIIEQSEDKSVADHTAKTDELSMEQQNTIEGVLEDLKHSIENTQGKERVEPQETVSAQTDKTEAIIDAGSKINETAIAGNEDDNAALPDTEESVHEDTAELKKMSNQQQAKQESFAIQPHPASGKIEMEFNPKIQNAKENAEFYFAFLDQVETTITEGKSELFIQLKPYHLGGLAVKLSMTGEGLTARLITSSKEVLLAMNNQLFTVQDALKSKNIDIVSMEVVYEHPASPDADSDHGNRNNFFRNPDSNFRGNGSEDTIAINAAYNSLLQLGDIESEAVEFMA